MLRKKGKLPGEKIIINYETEYSTETIELLKSTIGPDDHFLLVDDLVATGGTLDAGVRALESLGKIVGTYCVLKVDSIVHIAEKRLDPYIVKTMM